MKRQTRTISMKDFQTREDGEELLIEGYFATFDKPYYYDFEDSRNYFETIAPGAFDLEKDKDVRALVNHDTRLVLGRTTNGTLELRQDEVGLWGRIHVNPKDGEAVNAYERVKRGDVTQCSFGFDIIEQITENLTEGGFHWTITKVRLYEVSVVTFPAYEDTFVEARSKELAQMRELELWRARIKERLGVQSGN